MVRKLDLREDQPDDAEKDDQSSSIEAQARFEQNRRYDRRPAIQNLDRPTMLVTTREAAPVRPGWRAGAIAALLASGLLLILLGITIGLLLQRPVGEVSASVTTSAAPPAEELAPIEPQTESAEPAAPETTVSQPASAPDLPAAQPLSQSLSEVDFSRLSFEPGTEALTPAGQATVGELAAILMLAPDEPVEILVRTFSESTPGQNHGLSVRQAEVVLAELSEAGVRSDRLRTVGLGSSGAERPTAAAAIRTEASNDQLAETIRAHGPIILDTPFNGSFEDPTSIHLAMIGKFLADNPEEEITLVGYAWSERTRHDNHHNSHEVIDAATAVILSSGATPTQLAVVGLGDVNVQLADQLTEVVVDAGPTAVVGVSLGEVSVDAIEFDTNSATLTANGSAALENVASILELDNSVRIEVAVHTYTGASSQENHDLSQRQADAILDFLISSGVAPTQLQVVAHGDPHHFAAPGRAGAVTFTVIR